MLERRELLRKLVIAGAATAPPLAAIGAGPESDKLGAVLPLRKLAATGEQVTCLGLGGFHVGHADSEAVAQAIVERALESGIRFFDNAESYQKGLAEERYGRYLVPRYRDHIYLMTKTTAPDAATAQEHLEGSLKRMKTDVIDLWQIHSLKSPEDAEGRLAKGVLDYALKAREQGKIRHIGFTGHSSPYAHLRMLENETVRQNCITCQMPINPVDAASEHSFSNKVLPALLENKMSAFAMKTLADGRFFAEKQRNGRTIWTSENPVVPNTLSVGECIAFALSLPITVLITGAEIPEYVDDKVGIVKRFSALSMDERMALVDKVAAFAEEGVVEYYKNDDIRAGLRKA